MAQGNKILNLEMNGYFGLFRDIITSLNHENGRKKVPTKNLFASNSDFETFLRSNQHEIEVNPRMYFNMGIRNGHANAVIQYILPHLSKRTSVTTEDIVALVALGDSTSDYTLIKHIEANSIMFKALPDFDNFLHFFESVALPHLPFLRATLNSLLNKAI